jgi:hypothetical protein
MSARLRPAGLTRRAVGRVRMLDEDLPEQDGERR